ncbi:MAG: serine/threonine-protein phosphatase [Sphingobacteriia bacterium]|nr:serine/threonine-protein phosphatase [Sphingobacteriia bacterium]
MQEKFHLEVRCHQINHTGEKICGDVFLSRKIKEEGRIIAVLSDGMGHGVKANVLATLTATMAINFAEEHKDVQVIAEIIMNTLPICSERKISYSTFTIVDIEADGETRILEYDNPQCIVLRGNKPLNPNWENITMESERNKGKILRTCRFYPKLGDRIVFMSDGVAQSGMGSEKYPFGWGRDATEEYILGLIHHEPSLSASKIAAKVVNYAHINDRYSSKDDTSCAVIYFREPRKLLIVTGPPFEEDRDKEYGDIVKSFEGKKILCGATTADIVARELKQTVEDSFDFDDPDLPPVSYMPGVDLITEGILTLSKVNDILKNYNNQMRLGKGPADRIVRMLLDSDKINFLIGTKINIAHQDPNLPVELEIRRTVVKRIARLLEEKFLKEVEMKFI